MPKKWPIFENQGPLREWQHISLKENALAKNQNAKRNIASVITLVKSVLQIAIALGARISKFWKMTIASEWKLKL